MTIIIQQSTTRKFLRGMETWVDCQDAARNFPNSLEAFRHCVENGLQGVNIVVQPGRGRPPIIIEVEDRLQPSAAT